MASLNRVEIIGHLGRDPDVRHTQDGRPIVNLSIATSEKWKDKNSGEQRERTEWHRVVIFNEGLAGVAEKYLHKGSQVYIEGQLQTRKWTDKDNIERYSTEIVLQGFRGQLILLGKANGASAGDASRDYAPEQEQRQSSAPASAAKPSAKSKDDFGDSIPF